MPSFSFEEAVQFALERLHMDDPDPSSSPLRWTGLSTRFGKKSLLLGHFFRDGLQAGHSWDFQI